MHDGRGKQFNQVQSCYFQHRCTATSLATQYSPNWTMSFWKAANKQNPGPVLGAHTSAKDGSWNRTANANRLWHTNSKGEVLGTKIAQPPLTTTMALSSSRLTSHDQSYCNSARNSMIESWLSQMTNATTVSRIQGTNLTAVCGTSRKTWGLQHPTLVELQSAISPLLATLSSPCCTPKPSPLRNTWGQQVMPMLLWRIWD